MRLGVSAFAWTAQFGLKHLHLIPELKSAGVEGIEIPMLDPDSLPAAEIKQACSENEMGCTVCALVPAHANPISSEPNMRTKAIEHLKHCADISSKMGATLLGGPLYAPIGYFTGNRPTADEWTWATEAFAALEDVLNDNNLLLSIEPVNRSETHFLRTLSEARQMCSSIGNDRIGVTIDTFHANIEELDIAGAIHLAGPYLKHVHLSENDRGPLGRGHIPFKQIATALQEISYTGYLTLEGFGYDPGESEAPGALWASQDVSPQTFVAESVSYVQRLLQ